MAKDETLRDMLNASAELSRTRKDFAGYLHVMAVLLGDLLHVAEGSPDTIINVDIRQRLEKIASSAPTDRWIRVCEFLRMMENALKGNANPHMLTDAMALVAGSFSE